MKLPVKLQRDAEGQYVCIPTAFELPGEDAIVRKEGDMLIIEPATKQLRHSSQPPRKVGPPDCS